MSGEQTLGNEVPDDVAAHSELRSGFAHGETKTVVCGGRVATNARLDAVRLHPSGGPEVALARR